MAGALQHAFRPRAETSKSGSITFRQAEAIAAAIAALPGAVRDGERTLAAGLKGALEIVELEGRFKVVEACGYGIATIYCDGPLAGDLTWDEARRIAVGISKMVGSAP